MKIETRGARADPRLRQRGQIPQLVIYDSVPITWNARIKGDAQHRKARRPPKLKFLDGLVDERLVETKDFIERSAVRARRTGGGST